MIYTLEQLKQVILPILKSMPAGDEDRVADAIVEVVIQDRKAIADSIDQALESLRKIKNAQETLND